jgi:hypothetical protein
MDAHRLPDGQIHNAPMVKAFLAAHLAAK